MNQHNPLIGIAMMISAMALFTTKDAFAKVMVLDILPIQIIWMQFTFTLLVLAVVTYRKQGFAVFWPTPFFLQMLRGLAAVGGVGTFYWALVYIPFTDASAMILIAPLVVTALSPFMLGEKIGKRRILAVIIGFVGVLLILRPGFRGDLAGYLIALTTGLLYGLNYIGNRRLGHLHPPLVNIAHTVLFGVVMLIAVMPFVWVNPLPTQSFNLWAFLGISLLGHSCMVSAFRFGQASVIAPYQYTVILFATLIGYFYFGTFPDLLTWVGIALIVAAGIFIAMRESELAKAKI